MTIKTLQQAEVVIDGAAMVDVKVPVKRTRVGKPKVRTGCLTCKCVFLDN
jgi:hypothetical protein